MIILLGRGILGLVTHPRGGAEAQDGQAWMCALPTADHFSPDADVILAAQAATLNPDGWGQPGAPLVRAATSVGHLSRFADAHLWRGIP